MSASPAISGRLSHLLALADQGPALRTALAEEVADLLTHWPVDCPTNMRAMFETLLAKCARDADPLARTRLRVQLCTDPDLSARVLPRAPDTHTLMEAARNGRDIAPILAGMLEMGEETTRAILAGENGGQLAEACKRAGIARAVFSTMVITHHRPGQNCQALLDCFDAVAAPRIQHAAPEEPRPEPC